MKTTRNFSLRVMARQGPFVVSQELHRVGTTDARTVGLVGFGAGTSRRRMFGLDAALLGGFDAVFARRDTRLVPAVGARVAVAWLPKRWRLDAVELSVTGLMDPRSRDVAAGDVGSATLMTGVGTAFSFGK